MIAYSNQDRETIYINWLTYIHTYVPSLSIIVPVSIQFVEGETLLGSEEPLIERKNVSLLSSILSLFIEMLNEARTTPAGNVIVYGPEK